MSENKKQLQGELKLRTFENLPYVAIIVLNWNGWENTVECLESIQHLSYSNYGVILVDNGSTDNSVQKIKEWCRGDFPVNSPYVKFSLDLKPVKYLEYDKATAEKGGIREQESKLNNIPANKKLIIIQTGENLGYTGGNNTAINYALKRDYDYVWILNNDVVVDKSALSEMVKLAESDKRIGAVGTICFDYGNRNVIDGEGGSNKVVWPSIKLHKEKNSPKNKFKRFKWLFGGSMLIKTITLDDVGIFDDNYFLYNEDKDWGIRASREGWKLGCACNSYIWHKVRASTEQNKIKKRFFGKSIPRLFWKGFKVSVYYESRNGVYFVKKNYPLHLIPYIIFRTLHLLFQITLYDNKILSRIWVVLKGAWDGLTGKMGKIPES